MQTLASSSFDASLSNLVQHCVGKQEEIIREAQTMRQQASQYVLPLHCSFVHQQNLWMVMPYVAGGSVLNIMKYAFAEVRSPQPIACAHPHSLCLSLPLYACWP